MALINNEFFFIPPSHLLLKGKMLKTGLSVSVVFQHSTVEAAPGRTDCTSEVLKVETFSGSCQSHELRMRTCRSQQCQERKNRGPSFPLRDQREGGERQVSGGGGGAPVRDAGGNGKKAFQSVGFFWRISRLFKCLKIEQSILSACHSHHTEMILISFVPMSCIFFLLLLVLTASSSSS